MTLYGACVAQGFGMVRRFLSDHKAWCKDLCECVARHAEGSDGRVLGFRTLSRKAYEGESSMSHAIGGSEKGGMIMSSIVAIMSPKHGIA